MKTEVWGPTCMIVETERFSVKLSVSTVLHLQMVIFTMLYLKGTTMYTYTEVLQLKITQIKFKMYPNNRSVL